MSTKKIAGEKNEEYLSLGANVNIDHDEDIKALEDKTYLHYSVYRSYDESNPIVFPKKDFEKFISEFTDIDIDLSDVEKEISRLQSDLREGIINCGLEGISVAHYANDNVDIAIRMGKDSFSCYISVAYGYFE